MVAAFELVVVGCGGGPDETNLSSYLVKPSDAAWTDGIVSLEAGSGVGTLQRLMDSNPKLFQRVDQSSSEHEENASASTAARVYSYVSDFLITHAHSDHISSLILGGGSQFGSRKRIRALPSVIETLQETVFNDKLWPDLASFDDSNDEVHKYLYKPLLDDGQYASVGNALSARAMPISHGCTSTGSLYESTAFFIRNDTAAKQFMFVGDVEPDSVSRKPQTRAVWRAAAGLIPNQLDTIFLECSYRASRPAELLYGHLSPPHFAAELRSLAREVVESNRRRTPDVSIQSAVGSPVETNGNHEEPSRPRKRHKTIDTSGEEDLAGALRGIRVYIIHCKDHGNVDDDPPSAVGMTATLPEIIAEEIRHELLNGPDLGVEVDTVHQGMRLVF